MSNFVSGRKLCEDDTYSKQAVFVQAYRLTRLPPVSIAIGQLTATEVGICIHSELKPGFVLALISIYLKYRAANIQLTIPML